MKKEKASCIAKFTTNNRSPGFICFDPKMLRSPKHLAPLTHPPPSKSLILICLPNERNHSLSLLRVVLELFKVVAVVLGPTGADVQERKEGKRNCKSERMDGRGKRREGGEWVRGCRLMLLRQTLFIGRALTS